MKSAVEEIRQRFDEEIDRLAILKIGHGTPIDLPHCFDLVAEATAVPVHPQSEE